MNFLKYLLIFLIPISGFSQEKEEIFYDESGVEVTEESFLASIDHRKNLDLYFENDSTLYGILVTRQRFGKLDEETFNNLKSYLISLSGTSIDSTENIVVNYLSPNPGIEKDSKEKSAGNIFDRNYLKKLHKIPNIKQFWINSPEADNLEHYHRNRIDWLADKENVFEELFFPYKIKSGNFLLIKPDGSYYYYLGEYGKDQVWEASEKFFN